MILIHYANKNNIEVYDKNLPFFKRGIGFILHLPYFSPSGLRIERP